MVTKEGKYLSPRKILANCEEQHESLESLGMELRPGLASGIQTKNFPLCSTKSPWVYFPTLRAGAHFKHPEKTYYSHKLKLSKNYLINLKTVNINFEINSNPALL